MHAESVPDDIVEFLIQSCADNFRHLSFEAVHCHFRIVADLTQLIIRTRNDRRIGSGRNRTDFFQHAEYLLGILNDDLMNEALIFKERKTGLHFIRQADMLIRILRAYTQIIVTDIKRMGYAADSLRHDIHVTEAFLRR